MPAYIPADQRTGLLPTFNGGFKLDSAGGGFYLNGIYHGSLESGAASVGKRLAGGVRRRRVRAAFPPARAAQRGQCRLSRRLCNQVFPPMAYQAASFTAIIGLIAGLEGNAVTEEALSRQSGWVLTRLVPGALVAGYRVEPQIRAGGMAVVLRAGRGAGPDCRTEGALVPALAEDGRIPGAGVSANPAPSPPLTTCTSFPCAPRAEAGGVLYLAMRFVSGGDLRCWVAREGQLPGDQVVALLSRSPRRWSPRTPPAWCTGTSSRRTSWWTADPGAGSTPTFLTSGWPSARRRQPAWARAAGGDHRVPGRRPPGRGRDGV